MKTVVVAVGHVREAPLRLVCEDYIKRIRRFDAIEEVEVKAGHGRDPEKARELEASRLLKHLPPGSRTVALDERGTARTSAELARWLADLQNRGTRELRFVVGGAWGLSSQITTRCDESLRLSSMTLPHELARVVLLEQYYRAWTILRGLPYHNP
ncbi:MAG: 23S rRNA (pseudouridine(1915)-N(3))-methyltransferase RlmH [Myxococcota bacterium]|nr:23S rRNA (pseudouridine(1915)-N(3))-methyltransferase RlmH [Myxococcota bacterium]